MSFKDMKPHILRNNIIAEEVAEIIFTLNNILMALVFYTIHELVGDTILQRVD